MKKYVVRLASALLALVLLIAPASALTVEQAIELLEIYYYEELPEGAYEADSLDALLSTLDPYTEYMSQEAYQAFLGRLEGEVMSTAGIGVSIEYTEQGILVKEVFSGGGAQNGVTEKDRGPDRLPVSLILGFGCAAFPFRGKAFYVSSTFP